MLVGTVEVDIACLQTVGDRIVGRELWVRCAHLLFCLTSGQPTWHALHTYLFHVCMWTCGPQTSNLDGETTLKHRLRLLDSDSHPLLHGNARATVTYSKPHRDLHATFGLLETDGDQIKFGVHPRPPSPLHPRFLMYACCIPWTARFKQLIGCPAVAILLFLHPLCLNPVSNTAPPGSWCIVKHWFAFAGQSGTIPPFAHAM